jgi:ABC-type nitrate/sulfonate/bicarbonate transport system substrate-binding protein
LAQKKGFFKEEGLAAEVIEMRSPAVAIVALANGGIDYFSVIGSSVTAALRGPKGDAGSTTHARNFKEGGLKMK